MENAWERSFARYLAFASELSHAALHCKFHAFLFVKLLNRLSSGTINENHVRGRNSIASSRTRRADTDASAARPDHEQGYLPVQCDRRSATTAGDAEQKHDKTRERESIEWGAMSD